MNKKKIIGFTAFMLIVWLILHQLFAVEFRLAKEEFLIKRNYEKNREAFSTIADDFKAFPELRIDFDRNNYMDILVYSAHEIQTQSNHLTSYLVLTDTNAVLKFERFELPASDFYKEDSSLIVVTKDSIININSHWQIRYEGYSKTNLIEKLYRCSSLNPDLIERIKNKLIELNCFGYEKGHNGELLVNYRGNGIDLFSYLIIKDSLINSYFEDSFTGYGEISPNIFWYHKERIHVDYTPYMKLNNRKIK